METRTRSLVKALSWRLLASTITGCLVYCFTGLGLVSLSIGVCDSIIKIFVYFAHERAWTLIPFGRLDHPLHRFNVCKPLSAEHEQIIRRKLEDLGCFEQKPETINAESPAPAEN